ncbi:nonribosomal peptide synthetase 12 [Trametes versicolor FP-101664 SS1]|uniref:nonribosomal peptide synthetase 12 n=1 Tax=Trametes versicolor (strain FP-101664) TaxID=717944 RepID=UPI000462481B|nr:nonribosomal peptide synthetase 12 [Trametes versicolor FP-101664 SS1]EIW59229.1 nonribosomal peptide synthetase 12 [Trametes versicolor FP-101664 SS1]
MAASTLHSLSLEDQRLFARFSFGTRQRAPFACVHHAFEHHAAAQSDAVAVEHLGDAITYAELDRQANILANHLRASGVRPGVRVCLLVQRSILMVVGIIAVLKAGGAYVPLDGSIVTQSTLDYVLQDSDAKIVLTMNEYVHRVTNTPAFCLEDIGTLTADVSKPQDLSSFADPIYIIYTSGTTGKPKGVEVMHGNVTNLVCLAPGNIEMRPGRRVSQLLNVAFDMAAWEILGSLSNGCTLCVRGKSSKEWRAVMKTVDIVIATPSMMAPHDPADYTNIKVVATAGEPCPLPLAEKWAKAAHYYNCCGPTEVTIVNTVHLHTPGEFLSIGGPVPNTNVYVLDENMKPVAIGEAGVMWGGGACVSKGYVNLPEKTAERYTLDPFAGDGSYMFNTGDLGRWRENGELEHLGRVDDQVKVKGFRVELDGVSAAMQTCASVKNATALLIESELWGFVTPVTVKPESVKASAALVQPYYAVPTQYITMDDFPYTSNGKIDKRVLKQLALNEIARIKAEKEALSIIPLKPEFYTPSPYDGKLLADIVNVLPQPLPVYQVGINEKSGALVTVTGDFSKSSSNSSISEVTEKGGNVSVSSLESGNVWDGYKEDELPEKTNGHVLRNIRHQVFSLYRRMFGIVFITNMAIFIATLAKGGANAQELGLIVVSNLFCAILMRQDYVINAFFTVACAVPSSWPMAIRRIVARVYHIGGLHSGCAISGLVWLIFFTVQATRELLNGEQTSAATVAITYFILVLLVGIVLFAYPKVRSTHHDAFERTHRFLGWSATALVWCQVVLLTNDYRPRTQPLGQALVHAPAFWLVVVMTSSIILPWLRLRKVPVRAEVLSSHAVRLYFDYVTPKPGHFTRISDSPLTEWHGFATIAEPGKTGYSLMVSKAGDWTSKMITEPPKHLWVRGVPCYGVLRIAPLFRRVVFVATGSGIGPCAPCILAQAIPIRLLWTSPDVRKTFGDKFVDSILEKSPGAVIYDTRKHGKPDMVKLTYRLVKEFDAEAVCIISNQKLTQKVVYGMMSRGIPAFGAIWDS